MTIRWDKLDIPKNLENFVNFRVAREERLTGTHFGENATDAPHIDTSGILLTSKEDFGGAVPKGNNL